MSPSWNVSRGNRTSSGAASPPAKHRKLTGLIAAAALAAAGVLVVAPSALAASGPFVIDGVVPGTTPPAPSPLPDQFGNLKELGPQNSNTTKIGVIHNDALPTLDLTNPNAQVDLRQAWITSAKGTESPTPHDWLYFAWERDSNSGSGFIAYEFMKNAAPAACDYSASQTTLINTCNPWKNRTAGDFMILWDQQGGSKDLYLRTWSGTAPNLTLGPPTLLNSAVSQAAYSSDGFRGEAAVDLTATVFQGNTSCQVFANTIPSTVTGNSDTADYKDTILQPTIPISNCATIKINKVVQNAPTGDTTTFAYSTTGSLNPASFSLAGGGSRTYSTLSPGSYSVTEAAQVAPWDFVSLVCTASGSGTSYSLSTRTANITLGAGGNVECTYTNHYTNSPTITTSATGSVNVGATIHDTANLAGASTNAGGSITFNLYANNTCTGTSLFTDTQPVSGNGPYTSGNYTTTAVGTYYWKAVYSGDSNNLSATHACAATGEVTVVNPFTPAIVTSATDSVVVGSPISDTATLSGATQNAGGTIEFKLYPTDQCTTGSEIFTSSKPVSGNGQYTSDSYTPATVGTYYWIARYSGDAKNTAAAGSCRDAGEISTVIQAGPAIVTHATASITIGGSISDKATLSGGQSPTGTITFKLWNNDTCTGAPLFIDTVPVNSGNGDYFSGSYTPSVVGTYYWIARYNGDTNNAAATGACKDANEASVVNQAQPAISTVAVTPVTIGSTIHDTATLTGASATAGGTITFNLYDNDQCSGATVFSDTANVNGNGTYTSADFEPPAVGTYYWIASYSGDTNNKAVSGSCADTGEISTVNKAPASATTAQKLRPQDSIDVSAAAGGTPTGSATFKLYDNNTCTGTPVYSETVPLASGKAATSNTTLDITAASASKYNWLVSYSGDAKHLGITGVCGDENFTLTIVNGGTITSP